jgi:DNA primase
MPWIDFQELREKLDFRSVLEHYGVTINAKNHVQHHGPCPLPTHEGKPRSPSFSANFDKKIWRCFHCGNQGNILDFATRMEGLDPGQPEEVRKAALILAERFGIPSKRPKAAEEGKRRQAAVSSTVKTVVNAPLDFALKGLDPDHPYLLNRGFTPETIKRFELGFCSRGLMKDRIAIPLRNAEGKLIGYAGRVVDDSHITDENPKYRFPSAREHEGTRFEFSKSLFLYNGHAISENADELIIVEGFASVWWLIQNGYPSTVALMGATVSSEQIAVIVGMLPRQGRIRIFTDGNQAGTFCAESLLKQLSPYRYVRWLVLKDGKRPTDCTAAELGGFLTAQKKERTSYFQKLWTVTTSQAAFRSPSTYAMPSIRSCSFSLPFSFRQVDWAFSASLNAIARPATREPGPLVR